MRTRILPNIEAFADKNFAQCRLQPEMVTRAGEKASKV